MAIVTLIPAMYDSRIPGTSSGVNELRICVAPVPITNCGFTPGAVFASVASKRFAKPDWDADNEKAPPIV